MAIFLFARLKTAEAARSRSSWSNIKLTRDGLKNTPDRVARAYDELLIGYTVDPVALLNNALFDVEYSQMVMVTDIEFYSICEHHLLPIICTHVSWLIAFIVRPH